MTWEMLWPMMLVVGGNTIYNICAKSTPAGANAFLSLLGSYLVAGLCAGLLYLLLPHGPLLSDLKQLNWTAIVLGVVLVALEFGFIQMYRAGWPVSMGALTNSIVLAVVLALVGVLLYREVITLRQIVGMIVCAVGLFLISK